MRTLLPILVLLAAALAPTATAQADDAPAVAFTCDLPTIPEGTGPIVDLYEFADGYACGWVNFLVGGVPCVLMTPIGQPLNAVLCYYPTLPIPSDTSNSATAIHHSCLDELPYAQHVVQCVLDDAGVTSLLERTLNWSAFNSCLFYEDRPFTDTRFCTTNIPGLEHVPVVDELLTGSISAAA